jgi:hypothetical protein
MTNNTTYVEIRSNDGYTQYRFTEHSDNNVGTLDLTIDISNLTTEELDIIVISISGLTWLEVKDRYTILVKKGGLFRWNEDKLISNLYSKLLAVYDSKCSSLKNTDTVTIKLPYSLWNHIQWVGKKKGETFNEVIEAAVLAHQRTLWL